MDVESHEEGVPYWVALEAQDPGKVASFYVALFGWAPPEERPDPDGFLVSLRRGALVAAFRARDGGARPTWRTYVNVADVEAATRKVIGAGGSVVTPPTQVGSAGRMAVFADPAGAVLAAWQPNDQRGEVVVNEPGAYSWGELISDDVDASAAFYRSVFGWELSAPSPHDASGRREWGVGGRSIAGLLPRPPAMPAEIPPYWDVYFAVEDPSATAEAAARLGGTVLLPPADIAHGRIAVFADPAGAVFSVTAPAHLPT